MKSPAERGPTGAWAYEARADADLSVEAVVERLARVGVPVTAATLRGIEGGSKQPSRRLLRALADVYGRPVPGDKSEGAAGETTMPAALASLASAVSDLAAELRESRRERADLLERIEALETAAKLRDRSTAGAGGGTQSPVQTAG